MSFTIILNYTHLKGKCFSAGRKVKTVTNNLASSLSVLADALYIIQGRGLPLYSLLLLL